MSTTKKQSLMRIGSENISAASSSFSWQRHLSNRRSFFECCLLIYVSGTRQQLTLSLHALLWGGIACTRILMLNLTTRMMRINPCQTVCCMTNGSAQLVLDFQL